MPTLYRKYRPKYFKETVDQNHVKITLESQIQSGKIAHAYLFCGPRAVGKTTFARLFAKSINCLKRKDGNFEPCNKCEICAEINKNSSLDIIEIDAASHTGVDNVRENIIASARVAPSKCRYKVFIIDEVHMLSISAFNALLKIIEEPPENVVFILCTTEVHKVPNTIISRCQRFDFRKIGVSDIVKKLEYIIRQEKISVDKDVLESIARRSEGHMRDAESMLGQIVAIGGKKITREEADLVIPRSDINEIIKLIGFLSKKDSLGSIGLINNLVDNGVDLKSFANDLIEVLRKIMISKLSPGLAEKIGVEFGETIELKINEASRDLSLEDAVLFIEKFIEAGNKIKESFIIQLPFEIAIAQLCQPANPGGASAFAKGSKEESGFKEGVQKDDFNLRNSKSKGAVSKGELLIKWNEVLAKIKKYNHSLSFILRVCQPRKLDNNRLCLAFKYKFHRDRINEAQIKNIIEKVLAEVYGAPLIIEAVVDESLEVNSKTTENNNSSSSETGSLQSGPKTNKANKAEAQKSGSNSNIDDLLKTFGGRIVN